MKKFCAAGKIQISTSIMKVPVFVAMYACVAYNNRNYKVTLP